MKKSTEKLIENLKKQIAERKSKMTNYGYYYAIQKVVDDIFPYDASKSLEPATFPELIDVKNLLK